MISSLTAWLATHPQTQGALITAVIAIIIPLVAFVLRPSVRLHWGFAGGSKHRLQLGGKEVEINVDKHYLQNSGRKSASNVEFVFKTQPEEISVWQPRDCSRKTTSEGYYVVSIPSIAPWEKLTIDSIYVDKPSAGVVSVKNAECLGREIDFPLPKFFGSKLHLFVYPLALIGIYYLATAISLYFV